MTTTLRTHFGLRAWWGALMMHSEMRHLGGIVDETLLPILRLVSDEPDVASTEWAAVVAERRPIHWWSTPYQRWERTYGNFVRELDWAYRELRHHLAAPDFEALVVDAQNARMDAWVGWSKRLLARSRSRRPAPDRPPRTGGGLRPLPDGPAKRITEASMAAMWPIVGDIEVLGVEDGVLVCHIPDCAMHKVVSDTEPQTDACLYGCKLACEAFLGPGEPMTLHFEPNLPAFDCTMRVATDGRPADPARRGAPA